MTITFVINDLTMGGAQRLFIQIANRLAARGHHVAFVSLGTIAGRETLKHELSPAITFHQLSFRHAYDLRVWVAVLRILRTKKRGVIFSGLFLANTLVRVLRPLHGHRVIIVEHNTYDEKTLLMRLTDRILSLMSERIICPSESVRMFTAAQEGIPMRKFTVVHNGIDIAWLHAQTTDRDRQEVRKEFGIPADAKVFLTVARLTPQKGHDVLLESAAALIAQPDMGNVYFLLVGEGGLREELAGQVERLGISDRVIFAGARHDVARMYAAADYFLSTSRIEGFSLVHAEALSFGLPVVTTRTAGPDVMIIEREHGFFVERDPQSVARGCLKILARDYLVMSTAARRRAQDFTIEKTVDGYEQLARTAIGSAESGVAIVTFANLGTKRNLKTPDILPVIESFAAHHRLAQVICLLVKDFFFGNTTAALPRPVRYILRGFERVTRIPIPRLWMDVVFDFFAARRLAPASVALLHAGYSLPRTYARARELGMTTIDCTVMAHASTNARIEREEYERLGIADSAPGFFDVLKHRDQHSLSFDRVIAISPFVRDSYIAAGYPADRITVAYPTIDTSRFHAASTTDGIFRIVYVAYTTPLKGLHYLLDAWEQLQLPNAQLLIVGGYGYMPAPLREVYDTRIAQDPRIIWVGHVTTPEHYYAQASVFVLPSLTEGFPHVVVEAMASGLPVITTTNAKGPVIDGDTGFVVPIRDAVSIAEKIQHVHDHPEAAREMGDRARTQVIGMESFGEAVYAVCNTIV